VKKIVYIAMACLVSAACGGDGKSVEETCVASVDHAFANCSSDHSEKIAGAKALCAQIPDECREEASAFYDCMLTATFVCNDPPGSGDLGYPQTTDCEDEQAAGNVCIEGIPSPPPTDGGTSTDQGTSTDEGTSGDLGTATTNFLEACHNLNTHQFASAGDSCVNSEEGLAFGVEICASVDEMRTGDPGLDEGCVDAAIAAWTCGLNIEWECMENGSAPMPVDSETCDAEFDAWSACLMPPEPA